MKTNTNEFSKHQLFDLRVLKDTDRGLEKIILLLNLKKSTGECNHETAKLGN